MAETITRDLSQHVLQVVAQAMREGSIIRPCPSCGGPEILSKVRPEARCMVCGAGRELAKPARRWQCRACRKFYTAVLGRLRCPACVEAGIAADRRQERRERSRSRSKSPTKTRDFEAGPGGSSPAVEWTPKTAANPRQTAKPKISA